MYEEKLAREGFRVLKAVDGEEGLKLALEHKVDLILLDLLLPRVSGFEMLARLRQDESGKNIPVIALTNVAEATEREKVLELGAKEYLVKAMQTPEEVVKCIRKYL
jgi:DNA-binding response OmpR family regulator